MTSDAVRLLRSSTEAATSFLADLARPVPPAGWRSDPRPGILGLTWSGLTLIAASAEQAKHGVSGRDELLLETVRSGAELSRDGIERAAALPPVGPCLTADELAPPPSAEAVVRGIVDLAAVLEQILDAVYEYEPDNDTWDAWAIRRTSHSMNATISMLTDHFGSLTC